MKKLMMLAAAMTIVGGAYAANSCQDQESPDLDCLEVGVWDFTASGKTANTAPKGAYKTVQKFSLKGALVSVGQPAIAGYTYTSNLVDQVSTVTNPAVEVVTTNLVEVTPGVTNEVITVSTNAETVVVSTNAVQVVTTNTVLDYASCCVEGFDVYLFDKEEDVIVKFEANEIAKLTVFGKNFDTLLKPGKSTSIESDILWTFANEDLLPINLQFVGFGKTKRWMSKATPDTDPCGDNSVEGCDESIDWPSWSGWFTGIWDTDNNDFQSLNCDDLCDAIVGGTWSAKFNKKLAAASDVERAIEGKFKAQIVDAADLVSE